jgi:selenoprotein W-related protein
MPTSPTIEITYCRLCGWGLRAGWMAQELLTTFAEEIGSLALTPDASGGVFEVRVDDELIWSRKEQQRSPEITELKQLVRDRIAPERSLGQARQARVDGIRRGKSRPFRLEPAMGLVRPMLGWRSRWDAPPLELGI